MWVSKSIHRIGRFRRRTLLFLAALGPGIITMIADNDAGGISTYAQTGAKTGFGLLWAFIILVPMAYYVQEMTVRLGTVTKRGHAEAIFDGFGKFWGWFSIFDLALINGLTLVTEYIGMTEALRLFNIRECVTFVAVTLLLLGIVITGRYWTFEKLTFFFCLFNLVYIPAAIWAMNTGNVVEGWSAVGKGFFSPHFTFSNTFTPVALLTLIMANIGTTITPWQIFFQQSAVVDNGMDIGDINVREAPWFYVAYVLMLMSAGVVSLIASVEVQNVITIFVQVVAVTLLPAALTFLILLLNDKPLMGDHVNTHWQNIANWGITIFVIVISTACGLSVLFPELFASPQ